MTIKQKDHEKITEQEFGDILRGLMNTGKPITKWDNKKPTKEQMNKVLKYQRSK